MRVVPVPVNSDNYAYLLVDDATKEAAAVDPCEPQKVMAAAQKEGVSVGMVLTTHHHWDHAGGNEQMVKMLPGLKVFGGSRDKVAACTNPVNDGDELALGQDIVIRALHTPCHTQGHICFFASQKTGGDAPAVFTGDTLFIGGCGRFFEGSPEEMHQALGKKLTGLPSETRVFCGHEYTVKNLEFAASIEPDNKAVQEKLAWAKGQRAHGSPTVPSTIEEELQINPFLRVEQASVQKAVGETDPVKVMAQLRQLKNKF